ncbi:MAG TPA: M20/M25/M40 family metallo-hydrolase [Solirubrobacteraceae bacterium]|nr:M20/M25/M40 family metallo-hydrolase [Solirubrobacteraceae bacterium]
MPLTADASVTQLFLELVAIPSPSGRELMLAREIAAWLAGHGVRSRRDGAGEVNGSDAGNLIATVDGSPGAPALLFVAHMDTVESGERAVVPRVCDDGVIRSDGETILGADNKAAVAAVMRVCAAAARERAAGRSPAGGQPTLIAAFTCREESGRMGASLLDPELLDGVDCAFCVDGARPVGTLITRALGQSAFTFAVRGRSAHAAANPEAGINAIRVAAEAIAALRLGRLEGGGSASIAAIVGGGVIERLPQAIRRAIASDAGGRDQAGGGGQTGGRGQTGGHGEAAVRSALEATATNSIPDLALVRGEVRAFSAEELEGSLSRIQSEVARVCREHGAGLEWLRDRSRSVPPYPGDDRSRALALATAAAARAGIQVAREQRHATLEANHLAAHADVVAVASGGRDPHQRSESIAVAELERLERLLGAIVAEAAARTPGC